jgi:membrane protein YdbS with pleckstrin-like domain
VWWRREIFVPRARIQHTEVNQGPLDRRWGMASLSLHTAGTRLENIVLPGLTRAIAERLRDELLDRRRDVDGA